MGTRVPGEDPSQPMIVSAGVVLLAQSISRDLRNQIHVALGRRAPGLLGRVSLLYTFDWSQIPCLSQNTRRRTRPVIGEASISV